MKTLQTSLIVTSMLALAFSIYAVAVRNPDQTFPPVRFISPPAPAAVQTAPERFKLVQVRTWVSASGQAMEISAVLKIDSATGQTWMLELLGEGTNGTGGFTIMPDLFAKPAL